MAPITKKRSSVVGQSDQLLAVLGQLGIPTFDTAPTNVPLPEEIGGVVVVKLYYDTVLGSLRAWNGLAWVDSVPLGNYYTKSEVNALVSGLVSAANANQPNGWLQLDGSGKAAAAQLPSYVDDVVEFTNAAPPPTTGETGKIYVNTDTDQQYRWSGSVYVELSKSPGTTDDLVEGTSGNSLYFKTARVLATVLSGLSTLTGGSVVFTDTVLAAFGKIQYQINNILSVPTGGNAGQTLVKSSNASGDYVWGTPAAASNASPGVVALATVAEAIAGTDNLKAMTALGVLSAILDNQKNRKWAMNPVSLNEVSILMDSAGTITSALVDNITNLKLKIGYAGTYPTGAQTYPFSYSNGDVLLVTYTFSDANNLRGNFKLIGRDS